MHRNKYNNFQQRWSFLQSKHSCTILINHPAVKGSSNIINMIKKTEKLVSLKSHVFSMLFLNKFRGEIVCALNVKPVLHKTVFYYIKKYGMLEMI